MHLLIRIGSRVGHGSGFQGGVGNGVTKAGAHQSIRA